ncbi:DUF559 domain-containing protein [Corynebacterium hylobatis]|uniref:DUF559 domain-containing protein n=1 Tax=Corynebacterium hylobatis TaxID=1859290 RepID=A0A430HXU0_9CORY|nr:type IV toxin-antitoxin system AbiEi family antitoxin domain-containing protein [Corynebacterium hylobatis]RSZ62416.1 DUF559 domain-containing protein [Corynebacterium hylobatis]
MEPRQILRTADLNAQGISRHKITKLVDAGQLHRVDHGIYCTSRPSGDYLLRALQRSRPQLVFTGKTAWQVYEKKHISVPVHALVARDARRPDATYLRTARAAARPHRIVDGLRIATPVRAALDMSAEDENWAVWLLEKQYPGATGQAQLEEDLAVFKEIPKRLRELVARAAVGGDSMTERILFRVLRERGIVMEQNKKIGHYFRDGVSEKHRLIIEVNGHEYHHRRQELIKDYWKANDAHIRGYRHLTYSEVCIDMHLPSVVAQIEALIAGEERLSAPVWDWHSAWSATHAGWK